MIISAAIVMGLIGAVLSMLYERVAFALAGFYAAGYLAIVLAAKLGIDTVTVGVVLTVGLLGALLAALLMDGAIIVLSSLAGAAAIISTIAAAPRCRNGPFLCAGNDWSASTMGCALPTRASLGEVAAERLPRLSFCRPNFAIQRHTISKKAAKKQKKLLTA
jgi:hypothetical protein